MAVLKIQNYHKVVCKYCGKSKQSLVPANFVCGACKKFCEQQLSGEELMVRSTKVLDWLSETDCFNEYSKSTAMFLRYVSLELIGGQFISNEQHLSVCRILRKVI